MRNIIVTDIHRPTNDELEFEVLAPIVKAGLQLSGYKGTVDDFINDDKIANTYAVRLSSLLRTIPVMTLEAYAIRRALFQGARYAKTGSLTALATAALATYDIINAANDLVSKPDPGFMLKLRAKKLFETLYLEESEISMKDNELVATTSGRWNITPSQLIALAIIAPFLNIVKMRAAGFILDGSTNIVLFEGRADVIAKRIQKFGKAAEAYVQELRRTADAYAIALLMVVGGIRRRSFGSIFMGLVSAIASKNT